MPRFYKSTAKNPRQPFPETCVYNALRAVVVDKFSVRKAAESENIKKSTLHCRIQKLKKKYKVATLTLEIINEAFEAGPDRGKFQIRQIFSDAEEEALKCYLIKAAQLQFGLTVKKL
jgi:hypothetical protein